MRAATTPHAVLLCLLASAGCESCDDDPSGRNDGGTSQRDGSVSDDASSSARDGGLAGECVPGQRSCSNGSATYCRTNGTLARYECDALQGLSCTPSGCLGECDLSQVHDSYIGCDYYPTVTLNPVYRGFSFAVAISNSSSQPTHVTITRGATVVHEAMVEPNTLRKVELPWVDELKGGDSTCMSPPAVGNSRVVAGGAYRVRSDRPVTVYQFSPYEYQLKDRDVACPTTKPLCAESIVEDCFSYTNDASLLLPATALTGSYTVLGWPSQRDGAGFVAITATEDDTEVEVYGTGAFAPGGGVDASGRGTVTLQRGGVLELVAAPDRDPSGTRIRADKAVQVLSGHSCANVPSLEVERCDHLEEVIFPEDTLGSKYVVTRPVYIDGITAAPHVVRVAAIANDTVVHFEPSVRADVPLRSGEYVELALAADSPAAVLITGNKALLVTQYLSGSEVLPQGGQFGDPSMSTAVPIEQYRSYYLFTAPLSYTFNFAAIIAKLGKNVTLDGRPVAATMFTRIANSDYGVANVPLDSVDAKTTHTLSANDEVGLVVYGYGQYTSYMYPGGADLERITAPILF
jgi:hypothetical protein